MGKQGDRVPSLRICHVIATTEGAVWVFEQLRDLRDRFGHDVTVVLNGERGTLVDRFRGAGIPVLVGDFDFLSSGDLWALPRKIVALARLLRRHRFDVVQSHLFHSMVITRIAAWLADVPVRISMVAGPFHLEAYTPRWIDRSTQWMETALVPSCEHSRSLYRRMGVTDDRMRVIYYGPDELKFDPAAHAPADLRTEFGWPASAPLVGMVAYFYPELGINRWTPPAVWGRPVKCQADLIKAMPLILEDIPDARLVFIGSGWEEGGRAYLAKMQALVEELGLQEHVRFAGYRTDVPSLLKALDVSVQVSLSENLGGTIEGLLMECPMVASRCGGLVDSVIDGETGVLVEPGDPVDLARGIRALLSDPMRAKALGRNGRQRMLQRFTLRSTVEELHALYAELAEGNRRGYRMPISLWHAVIGCFVSGYLAARYWFFDLRLLPALDAGWRPWHLPRLRDLAARLKYRALQRWRLLVSRAPARPARPARPTRIVAVNEQFRNTAVAAPAGPVVPNRLTVSARMTLYRFYAFIGRRKLGWGLRRRAKLILRRIYLWPS